MKKFYALSVLLINLIAHGQTLVFHTIQKDSFGNLIAWYNPNHGSSYDHDLNLIWNFWNNIPAANGVKNYMTDHSYSATASGNKVGGDQFAMALSSWSLLYAYTGDTAVVNNMIYIANTYLANSLSSPTNAWANIPYPCNASNTSLPVYDGDYIFGAGVTQPDKAGSFGNELVTLYKISRDTNYLNAAVKIANTLAAKVQPGDANNSPYPFKVYANGNSVISFLQSNYTSDFVPMLLLFENLNKLNLGNTVDYDSASAKIIRWVKQYAMPNNNWGCFFEDIPVYSNTETNAVTMAWYILNHPDSWGGTWQQDARGILNWTLASLGSHAYDSLGVTAIYEQSSDLKEGGSHTSRFASVEMIYAEKTGDTSRVAQAVRQLDWATYLVDTSGQCRFSPQEGSVWYTDGYGDYVRHFLRAMAANPRVAPDSANHLLGSSSVITNIHYQPHEIFYSTFDDSSTEILRLTSKPDEVKLNGNNISETSNLNADGWLWIAYPLGGVLKIRHDHANSVDIIWNGSAIETISDENNLKVFPNPANDFAEINFSSENNLQAEIKITDITGKLVMNKIVRAEVGMNQIEINASSLSEGAYFVQLISGNNFSVRKIIVQR